MSITRFLKITVFGLQLFLLTNAILFFIPSVLDYERIEKNEKKVSTRIISLETIKEGGLYKIITENGRSLYLSHSFLKIDDSKLQKIKDSNLQIGYYKGNIVTSICLVENDEIIVSSKDKQIDSFIGLLFALLCILILIAIVFFIVKRKFFNKKSGSTDIVTIQ